MEISTVAVVILSMLAGCILTLGILIAVSGKTKQNNIEDIEQHIKTLVDNRVPPKTTIIKQAELPIDPLFEQLRQQIEADEKQSEVKQNDGHKPVFKKQSLSTTGQVFKKLITPIPREPKQDKKQKSNDNDTNEGLKSF